MAKAIWLTIFVVAAIEIGGAGVDKLLASAQHDIEVFQANVDQHRGY